MDLRYYSAASDVGSRPGSNTDSKSGAVRQQSVRMRAGSWRGPDAASTGSQCRGSRGLPLWSRCTTGDRASALGRVEHVLISAVPLKSPPISGSEQSRPSNHTRHRPILQGCTNCRPSPTTRTAVARAGTITRMAVKRRFLASIRANALGSNDPSNDRGPRALRLLPQVNNSSVTRNRLVSVRTTVPDVMIAARGVQTIVAGYPYWQTAPPQRGGRR